MLKVKVQNMEGRTGREVANQFIIETNDGLYFQSYQTVIAFIEFGTGKKYLDREAWDYSVTTGKYRNQFLGETKKETERKIEEGIYELVNLN